MYNEQNFGQAKKIIYAIMLLVIIGIIIAFIFIVCGRLDSNGSLIKNTDACENINPSTAKRIPKEWLERNCPDLAKQ